MMSRAIKSVLMLVAAAWAAGATEFYVSPSGSSAGDGSQSRPWDLQTALNQPASVRPGDTIWMRGGTYRGVFDSRLNGSASAPIVVRQYPGERAMIDGTNPDGRTILNVWGSHTWFWGFEIMSSSTIRWSNQYGSWPTDLPYGPSVTTLGSNAGLKFINLIVHDTREALQMWAQSADTEAHGCLLFYNGWNAPDRTHGHGIYTQNLAPSVKRITDVLSFVNANHGMQAYGTDSAYVDNFYLEGNVFFNNGALFPSFQGGRNLLLGGGSLMHNPVALTNFLYRTPGTGGGVSDFYLGYVGGVADGILLNNYIYGSAMFSSSLLNVRIEGNSFYGPITGLSASSYPNNVYSTQKPTGTKVVVRPNKYEKGRAHIIIYNWNLASTVSVDLSSLGLAAGSAYELRNAQDYFRDVVTGTYYGGAISVPMTGRTIAAPSGLAAPVSSFPEFGVFVLLSKAGTVPTTNTAPQISAVANQTLAEDTVSAPIGFTVQDSETSASSLTVTASSSNPTLVPDANLVLSGSASSRTVTIRPAANQSGTATITLAVSDGLFTAQTSFGVTVTAVNDAPTISSVPNQTVPMNGTTPALGFTAGDLETPAANLVVTGSSSNPTLVPNSNIVLGGSGANRTVTVRPAASQTGTATITLAVSDGALTAQTSFVVTVTTINTAPTISSVPNQTVPMNGTTPALGFTVGDLETPAANLVVTGSSSNPTLVPNSNIVLGGSGANRTVTVRPAANQVGTATITLAVSDGSLTTRTSFGVTVSSATATNLVLLEAEAGAVVSPMAVLADAQASGGRDVATPTVNYGSDTFNVNVPVAGTYVIWCRVRATNYMSDSFYVSVDGGVEDVYDAAEGTWSSAWQWTRVNGRNGGAPLSINPRTFNLGAGGHAIVFRGRDAYTGLDRILLSTDLGFVPSDVLLTNTAPKISSIANQTIVQGGVTPALAFTVSDQETPAANLVVTGTSSNPTLVPNSNIVVGGSGTNRTVTVRPAANQIGMATITLAASDGALTARTSFVLTVNPAAVAVEAESGVVASPMAVLADTLASGGRYVATSIGNQGSLTLNVNVPVAGTYVIWCRLLATNYTSDSFYLSVDGGVEDVYDVAEGTWSAAWQWTRVSGRNGGAPLTINPRTFNLVAGAHSIVFRGRDAYTRLDRILLSTNLSLVVTDTNQGLVSGYGFQDPSNPAVQATAGATLQADGTVLMRLIGEPDTTYLIESSTNLSTWEEAGTIQAPSDGVVEFFDLSASQQPVRFYRLKRQ